MDAPEHDTSVIRKNPRSGGIKLLLAVLVLAVLVPWLSAPSGRAALHPGSGLDTTTAVLKASNDSGFPRLTHFTALTVSIDELSRAGSLWARITSTETIAISQTAHSDTGMATAQDAAAAAAQGELGRPVRPLVEVLAVSPTSPAALAGIRAGDVIVGVTIEGRASVVESAETLSALIKSSGKLIPVVLSVKRGSQNLELRLKTDKTSHLGISIHNRAPERSNEFRVTDVTGGSAGLALALAALDAASPGDLTAGLNVVATGTISFAGAVGPISGIPQKLRSQPAKKADVLFVAASQTGLPKDARIHKVATLRQAVAVLCGLGASDAVCDVPDKSAP